MSVNTNAFEEQGSFAMTIIGEDEFLMPKWLCHHDPQEEHVLWLVESVIHTPKDPFCYRLCSFVSEEGILTKHLQEMVIIDVIEHKQGWVYFRGDISQSSCKELWSIKGIRTFDGNIIIEYINDEDELDMDVEDSIRVFELGDWVMPDLGAYQGDARCIVVIHDWGYDITFIPQYLSSGITNDSGQAPSLVIATRNEAHTLSAMGQAGSKPLIEDGLQILELSPKTIVIAGKIPTFTLQMFMDPCAHAGSDRANSMQALVTQSLWKCPRPQEWIFSIGDEVSVQAQSCIPGRVIDNHHAGLDVYSSYTGKVHRYGWLDIYKLFRVGNFVKILSEENWGSLGCIQCTDDVVAINVLLLPENSREISVWQNAIALTNPPQIFTALAPNKITDKMYTGRMPWQGINVIVLPSNYLGVTTAHTYKGQVGTVLDILLKQPEPSGIQVCICLLGTYRATEGFSDTWLDYDEVIEEITGLPLRYCLPLHDHQVAFMPSQVYQHSGNKQNNIEHGLPHLLMQGCPRTSALAVPGIPPHQIPSVVTGTGIPHLLNENSASTCWAKTSHKSCAFMWQVNISEVRFMLSWHSCLRRKTGAVAQVAEQFVFKLAPHLQFISVFTILIILLKAPWREDELSMLHWSMQLSPQEHSQHPALQLIDRL
ncbi:hypothetical protein IW262DRAFT_1301816 [Armillaria fumosa]|nr:hypothetical protein IW262DRAFT_1301816 [Armillaria fumosa]